MKRILVIRPGALGDTILTLPALAVLRAAYPAGHITFVGQPAWLALLADNPCVDATISVDDPALAPLFGEPPSRAAAYPPSLVAHFGDLDLAVLWLRDATLVAENLRHRGAREIIAAPSQPPAERGQHVADYLLDTLAPVLAGGAAPPVSRNPRLYFSAADRAFAATFWGRHDRAGRPLVAIHPGSGGRWKCWPAARFAALADLLAGRDIAILLVSGPADDVVADAFAAALSAARPIAARGLGVRELAAVLAGCAAFLGNDSGVSHLAAAAGVPTVAIYGPTDPAVWGVRGERVTLLRGRTLADVAVPDVAQAVDRLILFHRDDFAIGDKTDSVSKTESV